MIDPDLKIELDKLNLNLVEINKKSGNAGVWRSFFNGVFSALGYVAGLAIVVVVLGWVLQKTGLLKPFQDQVSSFTGLIDAAKKLIPSGTNSNQTIKPSQGGEQSVIINGQQYRVNVSQ